MARFANTAGALAVTKKGPMEGVPWREDVEGWAKRLIDPRLNTREDCL